MPMFEVSLEIDGEQIFATKIEAEDEDDALDTAQNEVDMTDLTMSLTGYISINGEDFEVKKEFNCRDSDVEMMFGELGWGVTELEEEN